MTRTCNRSRAVRRARRLERYNENILDYGRNWRAAKAHLTAMGYDPVYDAHIQGEWAGMQRKSRRNPYPAGRRHDAWRDGLSVEYISDPSEPIGPPAHIW